MEDNDDKKKEAYINFAKIAIKNSLAYTGSGDIDAKIKRSEEIQKALREARIKEDEAYWSEEAEKRLR